MTKFVKKEEINSKWYEIDAKNAIVGRLATIITKFLRGKNTAKTIFAGSINNIIGTPNPPKPPPNPDLDIATTETDKNAVK